MNAHNNNKCVMRTYENGSMESARISRQLPLLYVFFSILAGL